ncbi:peptidylprolyl isomerase [Burkholderia ubonensis]|uniref:peptidylprolyl isomerase n=1 Tax=Burkholderia ubonensis TaxID=101571 RepID=UPI001E29D0BA|nr:hypothetical protein [Burkholderia ubonensis]
MGIRTWPSEGAGARLVANGTVEDSGVWHLIALPTGSSKDAGADEIRASFEALARQYWRAPAATADSDLPWVSFKIPAEEGKTSGLPVTIAQALERLPLGPITPDSIPVNGARAIVKLDAKQPTQMPAFDQVQAAIRQQLEALALEKASAQFVAEWCRIYCEA